MRMHIVSAGLAGLLLIVLVGTGPKDRVVSSYATSLDGRLSAQKHNAVLSALRLDGATIAPGEVFSFNGAVGSWSRDRGYRKAPVSYNGQLVDSWGGGVCQTSTTLYNAALLAGMDVIERHPHQFAPVYAPPGRDAAVAYSNVDLRLHNPYDFPLKIRAEVVAERLVVRLLAPRKPEELPSVESEVRHYRAPAEFTVVQGNTAKRVRNSGKPGFEVVVWRHWNGRSERVSSDDYPPMHRLVEYR